MDGPELARCYEHIPLLKLEQTTFSIPKQAKLNFFEFCYNSKFGISKIQLKLLNDVELCKTKDKNTSFVIVYE